MQPLLESIRSRRSFALIKANHLLIIDRVCQLLNHGFTFVEAIQFVYKQLDIKDEKLNDQFQQSILNGGSCYDIFKLFKYPDIILMQIYFAEKYSELSTTLEQCSIFYGNHLKLKAQFIKAIQYPILLLFIFIFLIVTLNKTVIPEFEHMYATMQINHTFTQLLLKAILAHFPLFFFMSMIAICIFIYFFKHWLRQQSIKKQIDVLTHMPGFKNYFRLFTTYQISQQFSLFFRNGIKLNDIVQIYENQNENGFLKYFGQYMKTEIQKGHSFSNILQSLNCFEKYFISYIEQGEERDKLDVELHIYSKFLLDHIQSFIKKHIKLIQPTMFIIIGLLIMGVYLEMMLPVLEMMQNIEQ